MTFVLVVATVAAGALLAAFGVLYAAAARRPRVLCLMYHRVSTREAWNRASGLERIFTLPDDALEAQIAWLEASGHRFVDADSVVAHARGEIVLEDRSVLLTVDDGCASGHRHILPVLCRHSARAIFFVTADPASAVFSTGDRDERRMSDAELREIVAAGNDIGSHALTHRALSALSDQEVRSELEESKRRLEAAIGVPVVHFAAPANFFDARVLRIAGEVGYASVFCSYPGVVARGAGAMPLPRLNVDGDLDLAGFRRALSPRALAGRRLMLALRGLPKRLVGPRAWLVVRNAALRGPMVRWMSPRRMSLAVVLCAAIVLMLGIGRWIAQRVGP